MARSNRQRKRDRAKRQARSAQRQTVTQRRRVFEQAVQLAKEHLDAMFDPATPAPELAWLLADHFDGQPVPPHLAGLLLSKGSTADRLTAAAEAMLAAAGTAPHDAVPNATAPDRAVSPDGGTAAVPSVTALTFAASVARAGGDGSRANELLDRVLSEVADPEERTELADHLRQCGRVADAAELLADRLRTEPGDEHAADHYAHAIADAFARTTAAEPPGTCPCGSGRHYRTCCEARENAAVRRFTDRSALTELRETVLAYLPRSGYAEAVHGKVANWLSLTDDLHWEQAERDTFAALCTEADLLTVETAETAETADTEAEAEGDGGAADLAASAEPGEDEASALTAFAADPTTPAELAAAARIWRDHVHYGLWRIADPHPAPGLWCVEIVSGVCRYVEFPPELTAGMPRWAVWLGGVLPVDGVWRTTGLGLRLSPTEADAAADLVVAAVGELVDAAAGTSRKKSDRDADEPMRFGWAEPFGVLVDADDPAPPEVARLYSLTVAALLPRVAVEVHDRRGAPPELHNTDDDPMCLVTAHIAVDDDATMLTDRLAAHPDFDRDPSDPASFTWLGAEIPADQAAGMLAELRQQLRAQGQPDDEIDDAGGPQRWARGHLRLGGDEIVAEVNSRHRLARLLTVLTRLGIHPVVTDEKRVDPVQDFGWPPGPPGGFRGGAAARAATAPPRVGASAAGTSPAPDRDDTSAGEGAADDRIGWEKHWLDEPVPALRGRTPRQVAHSKQRGLLEALLRQFEYDDDLRTADGVSGVDTAWLRRELSMPVDG